MSHSVTIKASLLLVALLSFSTATGAAERNNIVLLFADDLGYGSVSSYGGEVPTPHIDSIGRNGVRFTSGYMTAPVCNPSRHGLLTGRYQQRWGKEQNSQTEPPQGQRGRGDLPLEQKTIADALKKVGYTNGALGKWQLSMADGYHPLDRGFDYFVGMASGMPHLDPSWPDAHVAPEPPPDPIIYTSAAEQAAREAPPAPRHLFRGRQQIERDEYLTDLLAKEGVAFIDRNKDRPFFLYLPFYAVHSPIQVTDKYYQRFPQYKTEHRRIYAAMISALDDGVGTILAKLREEGLEEKTLVFFTSDNGAQGTYDIDRVYNVPLTGHKRNLYGGGIRLPYLMQWKGRIPAGQVNTHPVSSLDIFPTALAAAGEEDVDPYRLDGVNLLPYLEGDKDGAPHEYLFWRSGHNGAVRHGQWKLLLSGSDITRLYNADEDKSESKDLSAKHPERVERMKKAFARWSKEMAQPRESSRRIKTHYNGDEIEWHI